MINLIGRWELTPTPEKRFMKAFRFQGSWVVLQEGYRTFGGSIVTTYVYDPDYKGDLVLFLEGETVFFFRNLDEYLSQCALSPEELYEGIPCPPWAVACELS